MVEKLASALETRFEDFRKYNADNGLAFSIFVVDVVTYCDKQLHAPALYSKTTCQRNNGLFFVAKALSIENNRNVKEVKLSKENKKGLYIWAIV